MLKLPLVLLLTALLLAGCEDIPDDFSDDDIDTTDQTTPNEKANDESDDDADETPASSWTWADGEGFSAPSAVRDKSVTLTLSRVTSDGISYQHTNYSHWPGANSIAALVYPNGTRRKFEWAPNSRTYRGWENVYAGYGGMPRPSSGSAMGFQLFSTDGKRCSNTISFKWP